MKSNSLIFLASFIGLLCGFLSTHVFLIGWLNLIFWGIVGVGLGYFATEKKTMIWSGILYGFFLSISFLFLGFQGMPDKLLGFTIFSLFLSILGAGCGLICVLIGNWIKKKLR